MIVRRSSTGAADDDDVSAKPINLFAAGRWRMAAYERDPARLPPSPEGSWRYKGVIPLGLLHVECPGTEPEPVIAGLAADGHYLWQLSPDA